MGRDQGGLAVGPPVLTSARTSSACAPAPIRLIRFQRAILLAPQAGVLLPLEKPHLPAELAVALEPLGGKRAVLERPADGAIGLAPDVRSRRSGSAAAISWMSWNDASRLSSSAQSWTSRIPGVSMTIPRRGQQQKLSPGGGVPAAAVGLADGREVVSRSSPRSRLMMVDLPTPDEPMKAEVLPGPMCAARTSRPLPSIALTETTGAARHRLHVAHQFRRPVVQVRLVEQDHRTHAALAREGEVALEPPRIEVLVHVGDDEERVEIGREDLRLGQLPGRLAEQHGPARQHRVDDGRWSLRPVAGPPSRPRPENPGARRPCTATGRSPPRCAPRRRRRCHYADLPLTRRRTRQTGSSGRRRWPPPRLAVRPRLPSSSVLTLSATSGSGHVSTSRVL